jgi:hypothetical protein
MKSLSSNLKPHKKEVLKSFAQSFEKLNEFFIKN